MKKAFGRLIWFFYNLFWAWRIYNEQRVKIFVDELEASLGCRYIRQLTEMQKAKQILVHCYLGAPSDAKMFFWNYYYYKTIKKIIFSILFSTIIAIFIMIFQTMYFIHWQGCSINDDIILRIGLGIVGFFVVVITVEKIMETKKVTEEHTKGPGLSNFF